MRWPSKITLGTEALGCRGRIEVSAITAGGLGPNIIGADGVIIEAWGVVEFAEERSLKGT